MPRMKAYAGYAEWKADQSAKNKRLINLLQKLVVSVAPQFEMTVKWGQGCFAQAGVPKVYMHTEPDHVQLGFYAGSKLDDPQGLLQGSGKYVRHVKVRTPGDVESEAFAALIRQVVD